VTRDPVKEIVQKSFKIHTYNVTTKRSGFALDPLGTKNTGFGAAGPRIKLGTHLLPNFNTSGSETHWANLEFQIRSDWAHLDPDPH
jgi:hypothetical protein